MIKGKNMSLFLVNQNNLRRMINEITNFLKMIMIRIIFSMIKKANNFFIYKAAQIIEINGGFHMKHW